MEGIGDVESLRELGQLDARLRQLRHAHEVASREIAEAEQQVEAAERHRDAIREELSGLAARERDLHRRIESYVARRRSAEAMLASGVGDAAAAMRQLDQVRDIVDELETDTLVVLEAQSATSRTLAAAEASLSAAAAIRQEAQAAVPRRVIAIEAEIADVERTRRVVASRLDAELRTRYERLLEAKGSGVAVVRGTSCAVCQRTVGAQVLMEVRRGRVHTCEGCRRYLVVED